MAGMSVVDAPINFNLDPQLANELFVKPIFVSENILNSPYFRMMRNVKQTATMSYIGAMENIIQPNDSCGFDPKGNLDISERDISVKRHKVNLQFCTDEFFDNCWEYLTGNGIDIEKLDATEKGRQVLNFIILQTQRGVINDLFRLAWFGDTASVDQFLSQADGWFKDIDADVLAGDTPTISTGSGSPLAAGASETIFFDATDAQLDVLDDLPESEKVFMVSKSIYNNYDAFLKTNVYLESDRMRLIDGVRELMFDGIKIVKCPQWDREDARIGNVDQHRLVLTATRNLTIATDVTSLESNFQTWFDMQDEVQKIKAKFRAGFRVAHPELVVYGV